MSHEISQDLQRVVYISRNCITADMEQLTIAVEDILDTARKRNRQNGITGALMFNQGLFAQVLEGPARNVEATFERIQCDLRHEAVSLLTCKRIEHRSFSRWSMAHVGNSEAVPEILTTVASRSGFDPSMICGDALHETLLGKLLEAEHRSRAA